MRRAWLGLGVLAWGACRATPTAPPVARVVDAAARVVDAGRPPTVTLAVLVRAPAASALANERALAVPLENALPPPARVETISTAGAVWLRATVPEAAAREPALRALAAVAPTLELLPDPTGTAPRVVFRLSSGTLPLAEVYAYLDQELRPRLQLVPGVRAVRACGGGARELQVEIDPARLVALGVSLAEITAAVAGATSLTDVTGLADAVVARGMVRLRDLAVLREASAPPRCLAAFAGHLVVTGEVIVDDTAAADAVRQALPRPPADLRIDLVADAPPAVVHMRANLEDPQIARLIAAVSAAVPGGLVDVDRAPDALPRAPDEIWIRGAQDPFPVLAVPEVKVAGRARATYRLYGPPELAQLRAAADVLAAAMAAVDGVRAAGVSDADLIPELLVTPDPAALTRAGLTPADLDLARAAAGDGLLLGRVRVRLPGGVSPSLPVGRVTLGTVARLEARDTPALIRRHLGLRAVTVWVDAPSASETAMLTTLLKIDLPGGVNVMQDF